MDDFQRVEDWASTQLAALTPGRRRRVLLALARALRKSQADRIAKQEQPDGSAFTPRRPRAERSRPLRRRPGALRRKAKDGPMFQRIALAKNLGAESSDVEAAVAFTNSRTARIAGIHQFGLRDRIGKSPRSPEVTYARRVLLGFSPADEALITATLADLLATPG